MKVAQYAQIERSIAAAETTSIRDRWFYGLRLLHDSEAIAPAGGLRHGVADRLIQAAGGKLSATEIRYRIQCARTYPKESQIANAVGDFGAWRDLISANFPAYPDDPAEPPADWRTVAERRRDRARELAEKGMEQLSLFPLDEFEPEQSTLKDLFEYRDRQRKITDGFIKVDEKRTEYLEALAAAVGDDWSVSWQTAHLAAFPADGLPGTEVTVWSADLDPDEVARQIDKATRKRANRQ